MVNIYKRWYIYKKCVVVVPIDKASNDIVIIC